MLAQKMDSAPTVATSDAPVKKVAAEMGTFVDARDGTEYKTCKIGKQEWLAENLKFELNSKDCVAYDDDYQYFDKYGYLYTKKGVEKAIPEGWHVPTKQEWETMIRFAKKDCRCKDVLSVIASDEWVKSSSDKYGFSMVPGGMGDGHDYFDLIDFSAHFWYVDSFNNPFTLSSSGSKAWSANSANSELSVTCKEKSHAHHRQIQFPPDRAE